MLRQEPASQRSATANCRFRWKRKKAGLQSSIKNRPLWIIIKLLCKSSDGLGPASCCLTQPSKMQAVEAFLCVDVCFTTQTPHAVKCCIILCHTPHHANGALNYTEAKHSSNWGNSISEQGKSATRALSWAAGQAPNAWRRQGFWEEMATCLSRSPGCVPAGRRICFPHSPASILPPFPPLWRSYRHVGADWPAPSCR